MPDILKRTFGNCGAFLQKVRPSRVTQETVSKHSSEGIHTGLSRN